MASEACAIGIDLGTSHSCVGIWYHDQVHIIKNDQGNTTTPSFVAFTDGGLLTGTTAQDQAIANLKNTVYDAKRLIGRTFSDRGVQEDIKHWPFIVKAADGDQPVIEVQHKGECKSFAPEEISGMVLLKMKQAAQAFLGSDTLVKKAVVTVPAYFNDSQRQATKDAATIAGLEVLRLLNEPTAAAIAYSVDKGFAADSDSSSAKRNVLVFDLGGGKHDASLLLIRESSLEVMASIGDTRLGGVDFDHALVNHFAQEFNRKHQKELGDDPRALRRLRTASERAKRVLSTEEQTSVELDDLMEGIDFHSTVTRAKFEELCGGLFQQCIMSVRRCLSDARLLENEVDEVVLVGGSTRIPKVKSLLQELFGGKKLCTTLNPEEAVAYGAAVQAAILTGGDACKKVPRLSVQDVVTLSLGLETAGGIMTVLISRGTNIPLMKTEHLSTYQDDQDSLTVNIYEGERMMCRDNRVVGKYEITGIRLAPRGIPQIRITLQVDADGVFTLTAEEVTQGVESQVSVACSSGRPSRDDVARMASDAAQLQAAASIEDAALRLEGVRLAEGDEKDGQQHTVKQVSGDAPSPSRQSAGHAGPAVEEED